MKKEIVRYSGIAIIVILFGLFIYPTMYEYDKLDQKYPVKINRITGKTEVLYPGSDWADVASNAQSTSVPVPTSNTTIANNTSANTREEPERDQKGLTFDEYFEIIKNNTDYPDKLDRNHEYLAWKRKVLGIIPYSDKPDDNGERFTIGSSKEEVRKVMGTPDQIALDGYRWYYGSSYVHFTGSDPKVSEYNNAGKNLKIE